MKDINAELLVMQSITAGATKTATTSSETCVDISGAESAMVVVHAGVVATADASNYFTITVLGNNDGVAGTGTALAATEYLDPKDGSGNTWDRLINATTEGSKTYQFGVKNSAGWRYLFVRATETGTASAFLSADIVLGNVRHNEAGP